MEIIGKRRLTELCVATALVFMLSVLLHTPYLVPNIYSDISSIWNRPEIHSDGLPYVAYQFEYPAIIGWLIYISTRSDYASYLLVQAVVLTVCLVALVATLRKLSVAESDLLLYVVGAPTLLIYGFYNWDLIMVALAFLAILAYKLKRFLASGFLLGLSIAAKLYSIVFIPVLLKDVGTWKERFSIAFGCLVGWLIPNMPFMLMNFNGWFATWTYHKEWGFEDTWLLYLSPNDHYNLFAKLFGFFLLGMVLLQVTFSKREHRLEEKLLLAGLTWCLFSYVSTPQMVLFLLPLFAMNRTAYGLFYASEVSNALIILTWFTVQNPIDVAATPQLFNLVRQAVWVLIFLLVFFKSINLGRVWNYLREPLRGGYTQDSILKISYPCSERRYPVQVRATTAIRT